MRVNCIKENSVSPKNFQALTKVQHLGRFNPEISESSKILHDTFHYAPGIQSILSNCDVEAKFFTEWFKGHPKFLNQENIQQYTASFAKIELFLKNFAPGSITDILFGKKEMKLSFCEYSNFDNTFTPLSEAELKLANTIKYLEFGTLIKGITETNEDKPITSGDFYNYEYRTRL